jgi:hypothetical protein
MHHFFSDEWRDGNFLIPANATYRAELLLRMEQAMESAVAQESRHARHAKVLKQRIASIRAYDEV